MNARTRRRAHDPSIRRTRQARCRQDRHRTTTGKAIVRSARGVTVSGPRCGRDAIVEAVAVSVRVPMCAEQPVVNTDGAE